MNESSSGSGSKGSFFANLSGAKKILVIVLGVLFVAFIGIQFVPVDEKMNPPVKADFDEDPKVEAILRRACYDCHSNEVKWPWYSSLAPASWLVAKDVREGREAYTFSDWPEDEDDRQFNRELAWEQVEEGEMPPWFYLPLHPEAELTAEDMAILKEWGAEKEEEEEEEEDKPEKAAKGDAGKAPSDSAKGGNAGEAGEEKEDEEGE